MARDPGKKWPIIIGVSIMGVIAMSVGTVMIASKHPVEMSDIGMQKYQEYDRNINEIIAQKIQFDEHYTLMFKTSEITEKQTVIAYQIEDKNGSAINNASIHVVLTRPDTNKEDIVLDNPVVENGRYTFSATDLPKAGRWDIMAKIIIGDVTRYYNLKADTRNPNTFEF